MTTRNETATPLDVVAEEPPRGSGDEDLGRRMGRDAQRVARGELSEAAFYEQYHDEVIEAFGFDRRPASDGGDDG